MSTTGYDRFRSFPVPARMGNLASSLAHLAATAERGSQLSHVPQMLDECRRLIEWTGPDTDVDVASKLVDLQIQLSIWRLKWDGNSARSAHELAQEARLSAENVLKWSGLLDQE